MTLRRSNQVRFSPLRIQGQATSDYQSSHEPECFQNSTFSLQFMDSSAEGRKIIEDGPGQLILNFDDNKITQILNRTDQTDVAVLIDTTQQILQNKRQVEKTVS
ncbi:hypothetical protein PGTUg99_050077 [Puccinia graminis f. sp. tritici]|uniref:Uncharacterized protein n=1 Tax=Puccinia graminis f. sp. tritici TaxID=56615 RepID=A0A5B0SDA7_PUCGR|nr:hypothetical protein PGTUg99_020230 [Puccinia graminis f. sp. tritici]KAA1135499.1 hypothetical protein PGTUg99_050077 [Puccinia graminis f. sp. tritici]